MTAQVGDTVVWRWEVPPFISGVGYRVFSVSSPSSTSYDGVGFTSGDIKTKSGMTLRRMNMANIKTKFSFNLRCS